MALAGLRLGGGGGGGGGVCHNFPNPMGSSSSPSPSPSSSSSLQYQYHHRRAINRVSSIFPSSSARFKRGWVSMSIASPGMSAIKAPSSFSSSCAASSSSSSSLINTNVNNNNNNNRNKNNQMMLENPSAAAAVAFEKMDEWMRDSVAEIVRNLREAPLLVHVYSQNDGHSTSTTLKTEKAVQEYTWPHLIRKWENRESPLPEGVIFVEQLHDHEHEDADEEGEEAAVGGEGEGITRAWGVLVQGKGLDSGPPACYLLKTSSVGGSSSSGLGCGCTHFCLMRVQSFRETAASQLKNCWLLQQQPLANL